MKKLIAIILILLVPFLIGAQTTYLTGPGITYPQGINTNGLVGYWKLGMNYKTDGTILGNYGSDPPNLTKSGTTIIDDPEYGPVRYFDGIDDYLYQEIFDTQQGALSYQGNDTITAEFRDAGQNFSEWTSSGNATYMLVVTNDDDSVSWGYCGASDQAIDIDIYTDLALTIRGWKGIAPVAGSKTASTYEIRRMYFQISDAFTIGCRFKRAELNVQHMLFAKYYYRGIEDNAGIILRIETTNKLDFVCFNNGGTWAVTTTNIGTDWMFCTGVFDGNNIKIYIDGVLEDTKQNTLGDNWLPLVIGASPASTMEFKGSIADAFIFNRALSAAEIRHIYDHPPRIVTTVR